MLSDISYIPIPNTLMARGTFGEISLALDPHHHRIYAVKTLTNALVGQLQHPPSSYNTLDRYRTHNNSHHQNPCLSVEVFNELNALRVLSGHENVTPLIRYSCAKAACQWDMEMERTLQLVFPYCPCDLAEALSNFKMTSCSFDSGNKLMRLMPISVIKAVSRDILNGLAHCHSLGILHGDIKPGNILISQTGFIQLCDFGLCRPFSLDATSSVSNSVIQMQAKGLCTLNYRSPEVLFGSNNYGGEVDIFGTGLIIAELLSYQDKPLFNGSSVIDQMGKIFDILGSANNENWPSATQLPDFSKISFKEKDPVPLRDSIPRLRENVHIDHLLTSILSLDPNRRPSATECLSSTWFVSDKPNPATPTDILEELVPNIFVKPLVFFNKTDATVWAQNVSKNRKKSKVKRTHDGRFQDLAQKQVQYKATGIFNNLQKISQEIE